MIYFDNAATSVMKPVKVHRAVLEAMKNCGNPGRSGHKLSINAANAIINCREKLGKLFNVDDVETITFTQNATHALNIAINSIVSPGDRVLVTGFEHNSVMRVLDHLGANIQFYGTDLFDKEATIRSLKEKLTPDTKCVIANHVSNVFGFIQPIYEISDICHEAGVPFIIDVSQSAGVMNIDQKRLDAAFLAMPGHKSLLGPQGTGVLISNYKTKPILYGGTGSVSELISMPDFLPDRLEAGTQNTPGIAGLSEGVDFILKKGTDRIFAHEMYLKRRLKEKVSEMPFIKAYFSDDESCQLGVISMNFEGMDCEEFAGRLSDGGVAVRAGLHCSPMAHKFAGTLGTGTVRVSLGVFNNENEVQRFAKFLTNMNLSVKDR